uniref:Plant bHLH transcription factor ACT-like domain-containing protein n=1 Tax=Kalanchoe fedtschenkoi TaxID=63787 RepID=A0A7N0ZXK8_KALFE
MVSKERKRAILHERLQLLRSITNSHAQSNTSIIVDASNYIEELKNKVEQLNQELANPQSSSSYQLPVVQVETLMNGYQVNVYSDKSCPGLLVYILEVFEELGLTVLEARASCSDSFHLEAIGGEQSDEQCRKIDAKKVKHATLRAIENWRQINQQE